MSDPGSGTSKLYHSLQDSTQNQLLAKKATNGVDASLRSELPSAQRPGPWAVEVLPDSLQVRGEFVAQDGWGPSFSPILVSYRWLPEHGNVECYRFLKGKGRNYQSIAMRVLRLLFLLCFPSPSFF